MQEQECFKVREGGGRESEAVLLAQKTEEGAAGQGPGVAF